MASMPKSSNVDYRGVSRGACTCDDCLCKEFYWIRKRSNGDPDCLECFDRPIHHEDLTAIAVDDEPDEPDPPKPTSPKAKVARSKPFKKALKKADGCPVYHEDLSATTIDDETDESDQPKSTSPKMKMARSTPFKKISSKANPPRRALVPRKNSAEKRHEKFDFSSFSKDVFAYFQGNNKATKKRREDAIAETVKILRALMPDQKQNSEESTEDFFNVFFRDLKSTFPDCPAWSKIETRGSDDGGVGHFKESCLALMEILNSERPTRRTRSTRRRASKNQEDGNDEEKAVIVIEDDEDDVKSETGFF